MATSSFCLLELLTIIIILVFNMGNKIVWRSLSSMYWMKTGLVCFVLVVNLFMFWGFVYGVTEIIKIYFLDTFIHAKVGNGMIQGIIYIGYFLTTIPTESLIRQYGFSKVFSGGALLFLIGALAFIPALESHSSFLFDGVLFIMSCGLGMLGTTSNVYSVRSDVGFSSMPQLHCSLTLNVLGWIIGPLVSSVVLFNSIENKLFNIGELYGMIASFVFIIFLASLFIQLPKAKVDEKVPEIGFTILGMRICCIKTALALLLYFVAQSGIFSFFIQYAGESVPDISYMEALIMMSFGCTMLFVVGRLYGVFAIKWMKPVRFLMISSVGCIVCMLLTLANLEMISLCALFLSFFFMSVMFPLILAVGMEELKICMKWISPLFMMGIVGSLLSSLLIEFIGHTHMRIGFCVPLVAFIYIFYFSVSSLKSSR